MTTLVVSPHLDDAVLPYGGHLAQLADAGERAVVYTVFAGSPKPPYSPIATAFHDQSAIIGDPVGDAARRERRRLGHARHRPALSVWSIPRLDLSQKLAGQLGD